MSIRFRVFRIRYYDGVHRPARCLLILMMLLYDMSRSVFSKIIAREIPANIIHEDELVVAFHDADPQAPVHVLIVPREALRTIDDLSDEHERLVGHMVLTAQKLARTLGLDRGYRLVMNCGDEGGQSVWHLHLHLLGGRSMHWPPG